MSFNMPDLTGLAMALHGYANPQQAQKNPGFLHRYTQATQDPLTSPTPVAQQPQRPAPQGQPQSTPQGPGLISVMGDAAQGKFQPGSVAAGVASLFNRQPTPGAPGFSGSATGPVPDTSSFQPNNPQTDGGPLVVGGIRPQTQMASMPPQAGPTQGPPAPMQGSPMPPQRPSDADLYAQGGPQGSQASIWGAGYHGPDNGLFNRMGGSQPDMDQKYYWPPGGGDPQPGGPGSGLKEFTDSDAMKNFAGAAGPNLSSFLNLFG